MKLEECDEGMRIRSVNGRNHSEGIIKQIHFGNKWDLNSAIEVEVQWDDHELIRHSVNDLRYFEQVPLRPLRKKLVLIVAGMLIAGGLTFWSVPSALIFVVLFLFFYVMTWNYWNQ